MDFPTPPLPLTTPTTRLIRLSSWGFSLKSVCSALRSEQLLEQEEQSWLQDSLTVFHLLNTGAFIGICRKLFFIILCFFRKSRAFPHPCAQKRPLTYDRSGSASFHRPYTWAMTSTSTSTSLGSSLAATQERAGLLTKYWA